MECAVQTKESGPPFISTRAPRRASPLNTITLQLRHEIATATAAKLGIERENGVLHNSALHLLQPARLHPHHPYHGIFYG